MNIKKLTAGLLSCVIVAGAVPSGAACAVSETAAVRAAQKADDTAAEVRIEPVISDFNKTEVNGAVKIAVPQEISAKVTVTFKSEEGEKIPYYDTVLEGGSVYVFDIEGTDDSNAREYTVNIRANDPDGRAAFETYSDSFTVKDVDSAPKDFYECRYDLTYDMEYTGIAWFLTDDKGTSKNIHFSFTTFELGDVDRDGKITAYDASLALTEYTNISANKDRILDAVQGNLADLDSDGKITAFDASSILTIYTERSSGRPRS